MEEPPKMSQRHQQIICNGTGEYYAKWNKPGSEREIPYDLTYK